MKRLLAYGAVGGALGVIAALMGSLVMPSRLLGDSVVSTRFNVYTDLSYNKIWGVLGYLFLGALVCGVIAPIASSGRGYHVQFRSFLVGLLLGAPLTYGALALSEIVFVQVALRLDPSGMLTRAQLQTANGVGGLLYYALIPLALATALTVAIGANGFTIRRGLISTFFAAVISNVVTQVALIAILPYMVYTVINQRDPDKIDVSLFIRPLFIANLFGMGFGAAMAFGVAQVIYKAAWLKGAGGPIEGRSFEIPPAGGIGCDETAAVYLPPDGTVAPLHAHVEQMGEAHVLTHAQGPVFVNGAEITQHRLQNMDSIQIGSYRLQYRTRLPQSGSASTPIELPKATPGRAGLVLIDSVGGIHPLKEGTNVIGREPGVDVVLDWEPTVSRRHAQVDVSLAGVTIKDLGSSNGTFHNGQRVDMALLKVGDEVRLGQARLRVIGSGN